MSSIIEGYNYDIFISYRQKDNKGDKWVSKFVEALKIELESTFKEEITVYFDINPQDGLLETHDVNESLKGRLKCLIFIPIISRTYCDPKSFAWEYEFKAFVEMTSKDQFGLKVKLTNDNIASRILPVHIHDLDIDDEKLCKSVLGGILRGIEFIYKEPGVNRPLTLNDDARINLNRTKYQNQINKVALAIKEIIVALRKNKPFETSSSGIEIKNRKGIPGKMKSGLILAIPVFILVILGIIFSDTIFMMFKVKNNFVRKESIVKIESVNRIKDSQPAKNEEMVEFLLQFNISNKCNLTLLSEEQFRILYPPNKEEINLPRKNIEIRILNGGLIQPYDIVYKIHDNLNNTERKGKITFYNKSNLLNFNGELSKMLADISDEASPKNFFTSNWSAFEHYYNGEKEWEVLKKVDAKKSFTNSIKIDPSFTLPYLGLAKICHFEENNRLAKHFIDTVMKSIGDLAIPDSLKAIALWHTLKGERKKAIDCYKDLIEYLPVQKDPYYELAEACLRNGEIEEALKNYDIALTFDPVFSLAHNHMAYCYSARGRHEDAFQHASKYLYIDSTANAWDTYGDILIAKGNLSAARWAKNQGLKLDSMCDYFYQGLAYISVQEMKFREAETYSDKYISLQEEPLSKCRGLTSKAFIYFAEQQYEKSLDTCLRARSVFDSDDLLTRNHVLHWIMSRIYLEKNDLVSLDSEMSQMSQIISKNKIDQFNYNMIFKFDLDIKIHKYFKENKIDSARMLIEMFDKEIYDKVKEWNYPFDIAYFNTEFGKLFMEAGLLELAKKRIDKALEYNKEYPFGYLALAAYYSLKNQTAESLSCWDKFLSIVKDADPDSRNLFTAEFKKVTERNRQ